MTDHPIALVRDETYVGDKFILKFMKGEDHPLKSLDGQVGTIVGFVKKIKYVLEHETNPNLTQPGVYSCLGDAVVRLENGNVVKLDLSNLQPIGYTFDDYNVKNFNYLKEKAHHQYLGPLPYIPYSYGDTVLVAKHGMMDEDNIGVIVDVVFRGPQLFYLVDFPGETLEVPKDKIIDVLELGEFSEQKRYLAQMQTMERIIDQHISGLKYLDEENRPMRRASDLPPEERDLDPAEDL